MHVTNNMQLSGLKFQTDANQCHLGSSQPNLLRESADRVPFSFLSRPSPKNNPGVELRLGGSGTEGGKGGPPIGEMITRSKLVEQLREYQIRSQHKWAALTSFSPKPHITTRFSFTRFPPFPSSS